MTKLEMKVFVANTRKITNPEKEVGGMENPGPNPGLESVTMHMSWVKYKTNYNVGDTGRGVSISCMRQPYGRFNMPIPTG